MRQIVLEYAENNLIFRDERLPFHMLFPFSDNIQMEEEEEADWENLLELLSPYYKIYKESVAEYCDEMEYDGSRMYDEVIDPAFIRRMCMDIIQKNNQMLMNRSETDVLLYIELMFCQEIFRRRCRRRRFKRHFVY